MSMLGSVQGVIDRRILVNYRVSPDSLREVLPEPFRTKTVDGWGVGGVCLIRLKNVRPERLPIPHGLRSENAAHRAAVEWMEDGELKEGVYVPRRDTSSRLNAVFGDHLFAGTYRHADFDVMENDGRYNVRMRNPGDGEHMHVDCNVVDEFTGDSVFCSLEEISRFFREGSVGYSPGTSGYEGVELDAFTWEVEPLEVLDATSSYFDDLDAELDSALLMRDIPHVWRERESICAPSRDAGTA